MDVNCTKCGKKIADYSGSIGLDIEIESKYFTRIDGTQPAEGSSSHGTCPHCKSGINELECTVNAMSDEIVRNGGLPVMLVPAPANDEPDESR